MKLFRSIVAVLLILAVPLRPQIAAQLNMPARPVAHNAAGTTNPRFPRYAVIDLGAGMYPVRIRNNGWVLISGADGNCYRWKGGTLEQLTTSDPNGTVDVSDMNNQGVVVGGVSYDPTAFNAEASAGMRWDANSSVGVKVSSPAGPQQPNPDNSTPGSTLTAAGFIAINDKGDIYGLDYTGGGFVWINSLTAGASIYNVYEWPNGGSGLQLSNCAAVPSDPESPNFIYGDWANLYESVTRANSDGIYIGTCITPGTPVQMVPWQWQYRPGTESGMISGQAVDFYPVALNEADSVVGDGMTLWTSSGESIVANGAPVAINDATRAGTGEGGETVQIPAPQILGYDANNVPTLWELTTDLSHYVSENIPDLIFANSGWTVTSVVDINDQGAIVGYGTYQNQGHGFILIPVTLTNLADPYRGTTATRPAIPAHSSQDTSIVFKAADNDTSVNCIAWIAAHDPNNNNAPRMPQLVATVAPMDGVIVSWQLTVTFHDRNNYPHRDFDTGDPNNTNPSPYLLTNPTVDPTAYTATTPDLINIPAPTNSLDANANGGWVQITDGSPWNIYTDADWAAAVNQGFFGGNAVLSLVIETADGSDTVLLQQDFQFRIAGENPDPVLCKSYITANSGGYWYAYAISKKETANYGHRPWYNQFKDDGGLYQSVNSLFPVPGNEGKPAWNDDRVELPDRPNGSGGYGLFQLTYQANNGLPGDHGEANYIMPRDWIWNWQSNIPPFVTKINSKVHAANYLSNWLISNYPAFSDCPGYLPTEATPPFRFYDTLLISLYNGRQGGTRLPVGAARKSQRWSPWDVPGGNNGPWPFTGTYAPGVYQSLDPGDQ